MRVTFKFILWLWLGLVLILGGLFFNAYSNFHPEAFMVLINEQVQKNYPGAKLTIGKMNTRLSVDFNLNFKDVQLVRDDKTLGRIHEIELKVPWWLLLFNRGNAQINISRFEIFVDHDFRSSLSITDNKAEAAIISKSEQIIVNLPTYLAGALYTIKAKDISVKDINDGRRYFSLSKLLVREFKYKKNSAFELTIPIDLAHKGHNYDVELWIFGDMTPQKNLWTFNYRGEFRLNDSVDKFNVEDVIVDGKAEFTPSNFDINSVINILIENENVGKGTMVANNSDVDINLSFEKLPQDYLQLVGDEMQHSYWTDLEGEASGSIAFEKSIRTGTTKLKGKFSFNGKLDLATGNSFDGKWALDVQDRKWEISFFSPKGEVSLFRRAIIDFEKGEVAQFIEDINFSGIDISRAIQPVLPLSKFQQMESDDYFMTSISYKKCFLGDKVINGQFRYGISIDQKYYQGELSQDNNNLKMNYMFKAPQHSLDISANQVSWISNYKFLEPYFMASEGIVNGKVQGRWSSSWINGDSLLQVKIEGMKNVTGEWVSLNDKIWKNFGIDSMTSTSQVWDFALTKGILRTNSTLVSDDPAKLTGVLSDNTKQKSFITLSYPRNRKWKPVKKEIVEPFFLKEI